MVFKPIFIFHTMCYNQGCGVRVQAILDDWSHNQKISDGGAGSWNLGSHSTDSLLRKRVVQIKQF